MHQPNPGVSRSVQECLGVQFMANQPELKPADASAGPAMANGAVPDESVREAVKGVT
jgi:hypothetical protein